MSEWERPDRAPELLRLERFEGEWVSSDVHQPMPWMEQGGTGNSREHFRKACDGYCYLTDIEASTPFGGLKGHGIVFYDRRIGKYCLEWYDNFGNHISGEGNFTDDDTLLIIEKYVMNGQTVLERHTDRLLDVRHKLHTVETFLEGEFRLTSELRYEKIIGGN